MAELTALQNARKVISQRASDPKAKLFGLSDDLLAIGRALDELELRSGVIAEAWLLLYERQLEDYCAIAPLKPQLHDSIVADLGKMNDHAGAISRRLLHGRSCSCAHCALDGKHIRNSRPVQR